MSKKQKAAFYVLFGFNVAQAASHEEDEDLHVEPETGYWTQEKIVSELRDAALFPDKNAFNIQGFGTPQQWLDFINTDRSLSHGYKFHLVKTCLTAADYAKKMHIDYVPEDAAEEKPKRKKLRIYRKKAAKKMPMPEA